MPGGVQGRGWRNHIVSGNRKSERVASKGLTRIQDKLVKTRLVSSLRSGLPGFKALPTCYLTSIVQPHHIVGSSSGGHDEPTGILALRNHLRESSRIQVTHTKSEWTSSVKPKLGASLKIQLKSLNNRFVVWSSLPWSSSAIVSAVPFE